MTSGPAVGYDLFPPVAGYRSFNAKARRQYTVSPKRQHADWSGLVLKRDGHKCQSCGATGHLEAHHIWPQSAFGQLRYILKNGVSLCRECHNSAYHAPELTPGQFLVLTEDTRRINAIIESEKFWTHYTAGREKGRAYAYGLVTREEVALSGEEFEWFLQSAKLSNFVESSRRSAKEAPITDTEFRISDHIAKEVIAYAAMT